jgi:NADH-quinone oxidoreductase subunit J
MAKVVGVELTTRYVIAFEVAGLLLTVALVGAIAIAHREEVEPSPPKASGRAVREPVPSGAGAPAPPSGQPMTASAAASAAPR